MTPYGKKTVKKTLKEHPRKAICADYPDKNPDIGQRRSKTQFDAIKNFFVNSNYQKELREQ
jgi:hypothetical protein